MEQTAIDFYHDALLELERKWQTKEIVTFSQWRDMYINAYKQAKEMEKQQIIKAFYSHASAMSHDDLPAGEKYYKDTYNSSPSSEWDAVDKCPSCGSPCNIYSDLDENDNCNDCRT